MKVAAKKSLGQHFLSNPRIVADIVAAADVSDQDTILEVGPGTGILTAALAERAGRVVAVEKDRRLIAPLREQFAERANVHIVEGDIMTLDPASLGLVLRTYKVVANIPYYITSHLMRRMLESWPPPVCAILMVQKEVADRLRAVPPNMNLLALSVRSFADVEYIRMVARGNFRPIPDVDSAVISIVPHAPILSPEELPVFFRLSRSAFQHKRKRLVTTLAEELGRSKEWCSSLLDRAGVGGNARPQELGLDRWIFLTREIAGK